MELSISGEPGGLSASERRIVAAGSGVTLTAVLPDLLRGFERAWAIPA